jgi:FAD/FMN-containing dehydrogenase
MGQAFDNDADASTIQAAFRNANRAAQVLRDVTPGSGAYQNEADVFEPQPEEAYWGKENYEKLLAIKKRVDPKNVLTCWGCIGWERSDDRYSCYPSI